MIPSNESIYKFCISGKPIAKKRSRFFRRGNFMGTYNSQETEESRFMLEIKQQLPKDFDLLDCAVFMECSFHFAPPKSVSGKKRSAMIAGKIQHTKKPDLDNLLKFVKDVLTGLVWRDDSQVFSVIASKSYDLEDCTFIELTSYKEIQEV